MLQHSQKNNIDLSRGQIFQTQFGLYKVIFYGDVIVAAEFLDVSEAIKPVDEIELNQNSFKEYSLNPVGSPFQKMVWEAVNKIGYGKTMSYLDVAFGMKRQSSVRAIATAIGHNPIAYLIPCHRVVRSNGELGGYRWGLDFKQRILDWENKNNLCFLACSRV